MREYKHGSWCRTINYANDVVGSRMKHVVKRCEKMCWVGLLPGIDEA